MKNTVASKLAEWQISFGHCRTKRDAFIGRKRFYDLICGDKALSPDQRDELLTNLLRDAHAAIAALPWQSTNSDEWQLYVQHVSHYNNHLERLPCNRKQVDVLTAAELQEQSGLSLGDRLAAKKLANLLWVFEKVWIDNPYQFYKDWKQECLERQERFNPIK